MDALRTDEPAVPHKPAKRDVYELHRRSGLQFNACRRALVRAKGDLIAAEGFLLAEDSGFPVPPTDDEIMAVFDRVAHPSVSLNRQLILALTRTAIEVMRL